VSDIVTKKLSVANTDGDAVLGDAVLGNGVEGTMVGLAVSMVGGSVGTLSPKLMIGTGNSEVSWPAACSARS
jgi:hypothetical protein